MGKFNGMITTSPKARGKATAAAKDFGEIAAHARLDYAFTIGYGPLRDSAS